MAKNAVYKVNSLSNLSADPLIKRLALGFDTIYIDRPLASFTEEELSDPDFPEDFAERNCQDSALSDYLLDMKVISFFELPFVPDISKLDGVERALLEKAISYIQQSDEPKKQLEEAQSINEINELSYKSNHLFERASDSLSRYKAIGLSKHVQGEFYPILRSEQSFTGEGTKTTVVQLVMNNLPQPGPDTPWEAIIDFRRDESTRLQYLALINWINEMATSSLTVNEISEKLEYLSLDYKRSIERHRLKWKTEILEIIAAVGVGLFTGNLPAAVNLASNFVKMGTTVLNLRGEEGKLPGKEIAYIYRANRAFY
ncbi:MAG: hypothetical protein J0H07_32190 [Sphingobacteriales bacterium]|nr:hypothetical protein [Sphingobacteriales bacterium]